MLLRVSFASILLSCLLSWIDVVVSQNQQPKLQPLDQVLMMVLDSDKDSKITRGEISDSMTMLKNLFGSSQESENSQLVDKVELYVPLIFQLLDANEDNKLSKTELKYVVKFEQSLKKNGGMRDLIRDLFGILDTNNDDLLSVVELMRSAADAPLTVIASRVHELFPMRSSSREFKGVLGMTMVMLQGVTGADDWNEDNAREGLRWIDSDGDGMISRTEVGGAYKASGMKFMEVAKQIKTMGPMLAMMGGGMGGGMEF